MACPACKKFFAKYRCSKKSHGECDCPKCQGYCRCEKARKAFDAREPEALKNLRRSLYDI